MTSFSHNAKISSIIWLYIFQNFEAPSFVEKWKLYFLKKKEAPYYVEKWMLHFLPKE